MISHIRSGRTTVPTLLVASVLALSAGTFATALARDVPYVPPPERAVQKMLAIAGVKSDEVLSDLGSGDGRIVIEANRDLRVERAAGLHLHARRIEGRPEGRRGGKAVVR